MLIGTLASPTLLQSPHSRRRDLIARVLDRGIDHVFVADHVSFQVGAGMDGLINAATLTAIDERLKVCVGVYLLALRHPVTVAPRPASCCLASAWAEKIATKSPCAAWIQKPAAAGRMNASR
jgi:alkanesulfonate monooxygenase SsuD/methylene tetrahydromethanopterin reductase-like flavin-dependent oxidoreductase (luciferase family)